MENVRPDETTEFAVRTLLDTRAGRQYVVKRVVGRTPTTQTIYYEVCVEWRGHFGSTWSAAFCETAPLNAEPDVERIIRREGCTSLRDLIVLYMCGGPALPPTPKLNGPKPPVENWG